MTFFATVDQKAFRFTYRETGTPEQFASTLVLPSTDRFDAFNRFYDEVIKYCNVRRVLILDRVEMWKVSDAGEEGWRTLPHLMVYEGGVSWQVWDGLTVPDEPRYEPVMCTTDLDKAIQCAEFHASQECLSTLVAPCMNHQAHMPGGVVG